MLMVVDVGNTNTVIGVYRQAELIGHWRVATNINRTADEYAIMIHSLLAMADNSLAEVDAAIVSCVVPPILPFLEDMFRTRAGIKPLVVGPGIKTGISVVIENPKEVGADRIVNAVAAYDQLKDQCIIIDFGTATTFDVISARGEYLGGLIFPGITISAEALFQRAAKLPRIEIKKPPQVIGRNTIQSIQGGIFFGYCELVDGIIKRIKTSLQGTVKVVATGGYADLLGKETTGIDLICPSLTLDGLRLIYEKNCT